jgi:putative Mg2+ transporter-C (MgtC) family protein
MHIVPFAAIFDLNMDWGQLPFQDMVLRLFAATLLGGMLGFERERLERSAGFRTHALVSVASALFMIVSTYGFPVPPGDAAGALDPSRIAAQVVSGIGFLGAGVIIFRENTIRGLTTAASIWAVAGVGLAAGGGLFGAAVMGTAFMLLISAGLRPLERRIFAHHAMMHRVIVTTTRQGSILQEVKHALGGTKVELRSLQFDRKDKKGQNLVEITLRAEEQAQVLDVIQRLQESPEVIRVGWRRGASNFHRAGMSGIRVRDLEDDEFEEEAGGGR